MFDKSKSTRADTTKVNESPTPDIAAATGSEPASDVAPSTHVLGEQTVDRGEDKVLPDSKPEEIAPVPSADGSLPSAQPKPAPSATGYRVAPGKNISGIRGDSLDAGAEIGPADVGSEERLKALEAAGLVVTTEKTGDSPERSQTVEEKKPTAAEQKLLDDAKALKP